MRKSAPVRVPLLRLGYFYWVLIPIALWAGHAEFGLPHLLWEERYAIWRDRSGYLRRGPNVVIGCIYLGPAGFVHADHLAGTCPSFRLLKEDD